MKSLYESSYDEYTPLSRGFTRLLVDQLNVGAGVIEEGWALVSDLGLAVDVGVAGCLAMSVGSSSCIRPVKPGVKKR